MTTSVAIVGASCAFPSGPTLPLADCALRAQLAMLRKHPSYVDGCGFNVRASYFPNPEFGFDSTRWCSLARMALDELADTLDASPALRRMRQQLWLVLPRASRGGVPAGLTDALFAAAQFERFRWEQIKTVRGGHAVGAQAIRLAADAVCAGNTLAVVLALDSWLHPAALHSLEQARLLHGAHATHEGKAVPNPYGRVPGEGAAALALAHAAGRPPSWTTGLRRRISALRKDSLPAPSISPAWALLRAAALGEEGQTVDRPGPCLGMGLTRAATQALATAGSGLVSHISADLNGEPYRADEFGFTTLRLADSLASGWQRTTPALVSGDIGVASAISQLALAAYRMRYRLEPQAERQLILCSSDDTLRAAMVVDSVPELRTT